MTAEQTQLRGTTPGVASPGRPRPVRPARRALAPELFRGVAVVLRIFSTFFIFFLWYSSARLSTPCWVGCRGVDGTDRLARRGRLSGGGHLLRDTAASVREPAVAVTGHLPAGRVGRRVPPVRQRRVDRRQRQPQPGVLGLVVSVQPALRLRFRRDRRGWPKPPRRNQRKRRAVLLPWRTRPRASRRRGGRHLRVRS